LYSQGEVKLACGCILPIVESRRSTEIWTMAGRYNATQYQIVVAPYFRN